MRPPTKTTNKQRSQYVGGVNTRTRGYRYAEKRLDDAAVCLIGWETPAPARFGDNKGIFPHRIALTSGKEQHAAKDDDLSSPHVKVVVKESIRASKPIAKRLKAALDVALVGEVTAKDNEKLRHAWRDLTGCFDSKEEREIWWGVILEDALWRLRETGQVRGEVDLYDAEERAQRIDKTAKRGLR
jgi:hypothetical protein